jgi:hypothetical protein
MADRVLVAYMGRWRRDALQLLRRGRNELAARAP